VPNAAHPPLDWPDYKSNRLRHPSRPLVPLPAGMDDLTLPALGEDRIGAFAADLTRQHDGEPIGERIVVTGRLVDGAGRPITSAALTRPRWRTGRQPVRPSPRPAPAPSTKGVRCATCCSRTTPSR
jgi:hypothetical protein